MDLEQLYRDNYRIVYGYLLSLCGDTALAEDLASETFLRGIQKISNFKEGRISTWLCAIGRNLYLNERKRQQRHVPLDDAYSIPSDPIEITLLDQEHAKQIAALANALSEPQRSVFFMRLNGMSFRDIGAALGRNETWARVTFFRIKNDILRRLEEK